MNRWLRRIIVVTTVGGGFGGIIVTLESLSKIQGKSPLSIAICCAVGLVYMVGIVLGVRFAERERVTWPLIIFYLVQVPWFASPSFGYHLTCACHLVVGY